MSSLVIWRFSDGKAGHDNQSRGLCEALARLRPVDVVTLAPLPSGAALLTLTGASWPANAPTVRAGDVLSVSDAAAQWGSIPPGDLPNCER